MDQHFTEAVAIKTVSETDTAGVFEVEGLYSGYGITVGTALRRVLFSSIAGAAITQIKIKGVSHEFTTLAGVQEDVVELMLNFKKIRFRLFTDEPQTLILKQKGEGEVTAAAIKTNAQVEVVTPNIHIATLTEKSAEFDVELTVERGIGYAPAEIRKTEKLPIGVIALDALFSPVVKVNFSVENMRVGERTDYNRLRLTMETDGSVSPSFALSHAAVLLRDHFVVVGGVEVRKIEPATMAETEGKPKAKRVKKGKEKEAE